MVGKFQHDLKVNTLNPTFPGEREEDAIDLDTLTQSIFAKMEAAKERYLIEVFGSYENAKEVAKNYVFEEHGFEVDYSVNADNTYSIKYDFRVRPKTPEEKRAEELSYLATTPQEVAEIHEWYWAEFSYAGWLECMCGYRPMDQEEMDAHIPPKSVPSAD